MSNDIPHKVRVAVRVRSKGVCERCMMRAASEMAHRLPRDTRCHTPSNLGHLCHTCHRWCHDNPGKAYQEGWMVQANRRIKPHDMPTIPARRLDGQWVLFSTVQTDRRVSTEQIPVSFGHAFEVLDSFGVTPLAVIA